MSRAELPYQSVEKREPASSVKYVLWPPNGTDSHPPGSPATSAYGPRTLAERPHHVEY